MSFDQKESTQVARQTVEEDQQETELLKIVRGQVLNEGKVLEQIGSGAYGSIFRYENMCKPKSRLVVKISDNIRVLGNEIETIIKLRAHHKINES